MLIEIKSATICKQYAIHRLYTNINFTKMLFKPIVITVSSCTTQPWFTYMASMSQIIIDSRNKIPYLCVLILGGEMLCLGWESMVWVRCQTGQVTLHWFRTFLYLYLMSSFPSFSFFIGGVRYNQANVCQWMGCDT